MQDLQSLVRQLNRPRLLVKAARFGLDEYRRERHLRRVIECEALPSTAPALMQLLEVERMHETARKDGSASYSVARHVESLIAIMGEARLLRAISRSEPSTGSDSSAVVVQMVPRSNPVSHPA